MEQTSFLFQSVTQLSQFTKLSNFAAAHCNTKLCVFIQPGFQKTDAGFMLLRGSQHNMVSLHGPHKPWYWGNPVNFNWVNWNKSVATNHLLYLYYQSVHNKIKETDHWNQNISIRHHNLECQLQEAHAHLPEMVRHLHVIHFITNHKAQSCSKLGGILSMIPVIFV